MAQSSPIDPTALLRSARAEEPPSVPHDSIRDQIIDAALGQFELFGITRSTIGDITRRSGLARMTLYRRFANKQAVVDAVVMREASRFLSELQLEIDSHPGLESKLTEGFAFTLRTLRSHGLLSRLLETEPEAIVPHLTVEGASLVTVAAEFLASELARTLDDDRTHEELLVVSELTVRLVVSFLVTPSSTIDIDDPESTRRIARTYLAPLLGGVSR